MQDFKRFDEQYPFYLEILLEEEINGINADELPTKWQERFNFNFPNNYIERNFSSLKEKFKPYHFPQSC